MGVFEREEVVLVVLEFLWMTEDDDIKGEEKEIGDCDDEEDIKYSSSVEGELQEEANSINGETEHCLS
jgi:hypothetical protein